MKTVVSIAALCAVALASCQDYEAKQKLRMEQVLRYNDSIPTVISAISTIQTRVDENEHVKLIIGSASLYDAPEQKKQEAAITAGQMALKIFGPDISDGTMIVTKSLQNHAEEPEDGVKTDMKLDSLKKAMGAK